MHSIKRCRNLDKEFAETLNPNYTLKNKPKYAVFYTKRSEKISTESNKLPEYKLFDPYWPALFGNSILPKNKEESTNYTAMNNKQCYNQTYLTAGPYCFQQLGEGFVKIIVGSIYDTILDDTYAVVYFTDFCPSNYRVKVSDGNFRPMADVEAVIMAIEIGKDFGFSKIFVYTESTYLFDTIDTWIKSEKRLNFFKLFRKEFYNKESLKRLFKLLHDDKINVQWYLTSEKPNEIFF